MNKKISSLFALGLLWFSAFASETGNSPLWMRDNSISPDGKQIVFTYKGDIFTVPVAGGKATQITSNAAYDSDPIWSPDGSRIVFSSDRMGSPDIYMVDAQGGVPVRLTTHSGSETPVAFMNDETVLYAANVMPSAKSIQFPSGTYSQVYAVKTEEGSRPVMFSTLPLENIAFFNDGKSFLYHDRKGYEDPWRKHHTSSIARDIWRCDFGKKTENVEDARFTKLTSFRGEDRNPVISPDGQSFYYLSELDGTFNVYKASLSATENSLETAADVKQLTKFKGNPVRFLSVAKDGTLCFGYDGEIYTMKEGSEPVKVNVNIVADNADPEVINMNFENRGASELTVSKDGKQIAFIFRGDVYVSNSEYGTSKRITNTAAQERNIDFAPDGRSIIYSSERDGVWQVYQASIVNEDEKYFPYATDIKEECLTNSDVPSFQALYSPDGKEVAFLENRTTIRVMNLKTKKVRTVMDGKYEYSYTDGDQWYQWSPDGKWILSNCIFIGGWNNKDVALIDASGNGKMYNLTESGYNDVNAKWVLDGKAMIWHSDRAGYRSHGSWGAQTDVYIMFFDQKAYEKFLMDEEELGLAEDAEKLAAEKKEKAEAEKNKDKKSKKSKKSDKDSEKKDEEPEVLKLDIENAKFRTERLTVHSSFLADAVLNPDGDKLFYLAAYEGNFDLWMQDLKEPGTKIIAKGVGYGSLNMSGDGSSIYLVSNKVLKINPTTGATEPLSYKGEFEYKPYGEREYILEHAWRQVLDKFYDPDIHGIDWAGYKEVYSKYLPHINNDRDFAEMLSEMLGELNASHTGARAYAINRARPTANLGVFYDDTYKGDGLKIAEIVRRSVFDITETDVEVGCIIEKIDGEKIVAGKDYYPLLEGKVGKPIRLSVYNPKTKKHFEAVVKGMSSGELNSLLYDRWVERNYEMSLKISDGKIGYVHIEAMDAESFHTFYKDVLGRNRDKDALIVDTRHNGGGWLHDDVITLLSGRQYEKFVPRGQFIGNDPFNKWLKPSAMLVCEDNYSNAHGTPWVYQTMGVGKLVGAPVPGTMTAVWWETQINPFIVFGIPQVGCMDMQGNYLENKELIPEIIIYNSPEDVMNGVDHQIEAAVKELQSEVAADKK